MQIRPGTDDVPESFDPELRWDHLMAVSVDDPPRERGEASR